MKHSIFDHDLRALRRDRAHRTGPVLFLYDRLFDEILERLSLVQRRFDSALLVGCPDPSWPGRLGAMVGQVTTVDPGPLFASAAGGTRMIGELPAAEPESFDLCVVVGIVDTANALDNLMLALRFALRPDGLLIGAIPGGQSLPALRSAMRAADQVSGEASPHVHPMVDAPGLGGLLTAAGLLMPVIDVDRVDVRYRSLNSLVADLRGMAATNVLTARARTPLGRREAAAAAAQFAALGEAGRTVERFEILHFAAWSPPRTDPPA